MLRITLSILLVSIALPASATTLRPYTSGELQARTEIMVLGVVRSQSSQFIGRRIYSDTVIDIEALYRGPKNLKTLSVRTLGGIAQGIGQNVSGEVQFHLNERVLLMLETRANSLRVVGFNQGLWKVNDQGGLYQNLPRSHSVGSEHPADAAFPAELGHIPNWLKAAQP